MLIDFTVSNFRSIREQMMLSAVAQKQSAKAGGRRTVKTDEEIGESVPIAGRDLSLLPVLGIFGANASGKTSVLHALDRFLSLAAWGNDPEDGHFPGIVPHALGVRNEEPTTFEIRCVFGGVIYTYALSLDAKRILSEELSYTPAPPRRARLLYRRLFDAGTKEYAWRNGEDFDGPHTQLQKQIKASQPYLAVLAQSLDVAIIAPFTDWLTLRSPGIHSGADAATYHQAVRACFDDEDARLAIVSMICDFDTGIDDIQVERSELRSMSGGADHYQAYAVHNTSAGEFRLPLEAESSGTLHLFVLAYRIFLAEQHGTLLILDEFGAYVHSKLTETLVKRFQMSGGAYEEQLVFASHDTTLQGSDTLRRDQIWFTQKDENGATQLYPLTDFKPRNDLVIDRAYLDGRFGAVPLIRDDFLRRSPKVEAE